jgi:hypothetical protein
VEEEKRLAIFKVGCVSRFGHFGLFWPIRNEEDEKMNIDKLLGQWSAASGNHTKGMVIVRATLERWMYNEKRYVPVARSDEWGGGVVSGR